MCTWCTGKKPPCGGNTSNRRYRVISQFQYWHYIIVSRLAKIPLKAKIIRYTLYLIMYLISINMYISTWWVHLLGCLSKSSMENTLIFKAACNPSEHLVLDLVSLIHIANNVPLLLIEFMQFL